MKYIFRLTLLGCVIFLAFFFRVTAYAKTVSTTRTSNVNSFPDTIWYDDGTWNGNLYKSGSVISKVISGSPASTMEYREPSNPNYYLTSSLDSNVKYAIKTTYGTQYKKWGVYKWINGEWQYSGTLDSREFPKWPYSQLSTQYDWVYELYKPVTIGEYSGTAERIGVASNWYTYTPDPPHNGINQVLNSYYDYYYYRATLSKPDTRVWQYTQNYSGTVYLKRDAHVTDNMPKSMVSGQRYTFQVYAKNTGTLTWVGNSNFNMRGCADNGSQDGNNPFGISAKVGSNVTTCNTYTFNITITAPAPGTYRQSFKMVQDGVSWFGNNDIEIITVLPANTKPKAYFTVSSPVLTGQKLSYNDTSSANDSWDSISQREWSYSSDGGTTWSSASSTPPTSFNLTQFPLTNSNGTYKIRLRVKDTGNALSPGIWSDYCIQNVVVYRINTKPIAAFTVDPNPQISGQSLTIVDNSTVNDSWDKWNDVNPKMWNWCSSTDEGKTWTAWQPSDVSNKLIAFTVNVPTIYRIRLTVKDTGNILSGPLTDSTTRDVKIIPMNIYKHDAEITKYDYYDSPGNIYWAAMGNTFTVKISGYTDYSADEYKINGLYSIIRPWANGEDNFSQLHIFDGFINNSQTTSTDIKEGAKTWDSDCYKTDGSIIKRTNGTWAEMDLNLQSYTDGADYRINPMLRIYDNGVHDDNKIVRETPYIGGSVHLKIDGQAPTGYVNAYIDYPSPNIVINAENVSDNGGSGVNNLYAVLTDPNTHQSKTVPMAKVDTNGDAWLTGVEKWTVTTNAFVFNGTKLQVEVYAKDNVGNTSKLYDDLFDLLSVTCDLKYSPSKQGKQVIFDIKTKGYAKYLKVYLPDDITSQDKSGTVFPLSKQITPEPSHEENIPYILPLTTPQTLNADGRIRPQYTIKIEASRDDGSKANTTVYLDVKDNVLDGIKTEIIGTGYDADK